jgi:hypothetical protein
MGSWNLRDELYPQIVDYPLLPSNNGLRPTKAPIFAEGNIHQGLLNSLKQLGIPFFHHYFPAPAQEVVGSLRPLGDPNDLSNLLDSIPREKIKTLRLAQGVARSILQHFAQAPKAQLNHEQRKKLKALPIFPTVQTKSLVPATVWGSIPGDKNLFSVSMATLRILPTIHNIIFLDESLVGSSFLMILDPYARGPLSGHDILSLALANFAIQTSQTQANFMEYIVQEREHLPLLVFEQFLQAMESVPVSECLQALNPASQALLAEWLRSQITMVPQHLRSVARALPIWLSTHPSSTKTLLLPADDLKMLPDGITCAAVAPFVNIPVTEYSSDLMSLITTPAMTWTELFNNIQSSTPRLSPPERPKYRDLLRILISTTIDSPWVPVPNSHDIVCSSSDLYARDELFLSAFGPESAHFVAGAFQEFEPQLSAKFGLKCQRNISMDTFRECAAAISSDSSPDRAKRARTVFRFYCEQLPLHDSSDQRWRTLDDLEFIPRRAFQRKTMTGRNVSVYLRYHDLPDVVAPKYVLLEKHEAIAWTQRALILEEPAILQILRVQPNFGQPTVAEVVRCSPFSIC